MAASVLLTIGEQEDLVDEIKERALQLSCGQEVSGHMGPVCFCLFFIFLWRLSINNQKIKLFGTSMKPRMPELRFCWMVVFGGQRMDFGLDLRSSSTKIVKFFFPLIFTYEGADRALHEEIFGPVLSILAVKTKEEAIEIENGNSYGNAACIYTRDGGVTEWFTKRFSAGMIGINLLVFNSYIFDLVSDCLKLFSMS
jgi:malonate-semialdehyde dehydrogenase (acetylating)/methylmalonate-semialdehyde dehydrogenase